MDWQSATNNINLDVQPTAMVVGKGVQGRQPRERYRHPDLWSVHLYPYEAEVVVDGCRYPIRPGYASVVAPNAKIEYRVPRPSAHLYAHFVVPSGGKLMPIRTMQDTGDRFNRLWADFEQAIIYRWDIPVRVSVRLWDILWDLALSDQKPIPYGDEIAFGRITKTDGIGTAAIQLIEAHLGDELSVSKLAGWLGISRNHLTRLFKDVTGETVITYIQKRRIEHARLLLCHTDRPVSVIAAEVGIPNAQHFNKSIRRFLGASPSQVRSNASATSTAMPIATRSNRSG